MRYVTVMLVALLIGISAASAQSSLPAVSEQPSTTSATKPQAGSEPVLDFEAWGKALGGVTSVRIEFSLSMEDAVFHKNREYDGVLLFLKPHFMILRLNYTADSTKTDYQAFICNGTSVYYYSGLDKTVTEWKLTPSTKNNTEGESALERWARFLNGSEQIMRLGELLSGMNPKDLRQRFEIHVIKEDEYYIYLDMKPKLKKDKQKFQQIRMALYGPKTKYAYLPARIYILEPNGNTEKWEITDLKTNIPGLEEKHFQYTPVVGFTLREVPSAPKPEPAPSAPDKTEPTPTAPDNQTPESPVLQSYYPGSVECPCVPRIRLRDRIRWRMLRD